MYIENNYDPLNLESVNRALNDYEKQLEENKDSFYLQAKVSECQSFKALHLKTYYSHLVFASDALKFYKLYEESKSA